MKLSPPEIILPAPSPVRELRDVPQCMMVWSGCTPVMPPSQFCAPWHTIAVHPQNIIMPPVRGPHTHTALRAHTTHHVHSTQRSTQQDPPAA